MQAEIRLSTAENPSPAPWVWRVWEQGRLVARGQSITEEEAQQAVRVLMGHDHASVGSGPKPEVPTAVAAKRPAKPSQPAEPSA
jgi:hypothetical protein